MTLILERAPIILWVLTYINETGKGNGVLTRYELNSMRSFRPFMKK